MRNWLVRATAAVLRVDTLEAAQPEDEADYLREYDGETNVTVDDDLFVGEPSAEGVEAMMDELGVNAVELVDPIQGIEEIEDDPSMCYVWKLSDSDPAFKNRLAERIQQVYNGEPDALHMFVEDVQELKRWDAHKVEHEIIPWLADAKTLETEP